MKTVISKKMLGEPLMGSSLHRESWSWRQQPGQRQSSFRIKQVMADVRCQRTCLSSADSTPCTASSWYCLCFRLLGNFLMWRIAVLSDSFDPGSRTRRARAPLFLCSTPTTKRLWPADRAGSWRDGTTNQTNYGSPNIAPKWTHRNSSINSRNHDGISCDHRWQPRAKDEDSLTCRQLTFHTAADVLTGIPQSDLFWSPANSCNYPIWA